ncbi:IPT/TIG domain-containing protein [Muricauda sp. 2012CJ35-5]|uniref:IPT/TIG domain-containing protein n=1 Tax=Flagellimonas spongiicola TaxID=2942208 RepID=A0ABT0PQZ2_9FLAO|nr:IPT/TIG domain-containing protein [Allomuricauda spongiicola]MCL6273789.1 IPT/TIG domain-containing protein [Allomuricauda spongiicola]
MNKSILMYASCILAVLLFVFCGKDDPKDQETPGTNPPTIKSFSPPEGPVGTEVTINGTNFSATAGENKVRFNGTNATVTTNTTSLLKAIVPTGASTGTLSVEVNGETANSPESFTVTTISNSQLAISDFEPQKGSIGTQIEINGSNFGESFEDITVYFNGTATDIDQLSNSRLLVKVPEGATTGPIEVTVGNETVTSTASFTVGPTISGFTPDQENEGVIVEINGSNFSTVPENNVVKFNNVAAQVTDATSTMLTVILPNGATTGNISVEVAGQTTESADEFTVGPWKKLSSPSDIEYPIQGGNMAVLENENGDAEIYFGFGRYNNGSLVYSNDIYVYDIVNDSWVKRQPSMATPRFEATSFVLNNKWHIITGKNGNGDIDDSWSFDPASATWENLGTTDWGSGLSSFCSDLACFVYGAEEDTEKGKLKFYNGSWTDRESFTVSNEGIVNAVGFTISGLGFIVTGTVGENYASSLYRYRLNINEWDQLAPVPFTLRKDAIGIGLGNKAYVGLGIDHTLSKYLEDIWEYDGGTNQWTQKSNFPGGGRQGATSVATGGHIYIYGGEGSGIDPELESFWRYTPLLDLEEM